MAAYSRDGAPSGAAAATALAVKGITLLVFSGRAGPLATGSPAFAAVLPGTSHRIAHLRLKHFARR